MDFSFQLPKYHHVRPQSIQKFDYNKSTIILTAGPTGSGKSVLLAKTLELLYHQKPIPRFYEFLLDNYIESSIAYKNKIDKIISKFNCRQSLQHGSCNVIEPSTQLLKAFEEAYFEIRKRGPCNSKSRNTQESCQKIFDSEVINAINHNQNICLETTGINMPNFWFIAYENLQNYNVVFVYSIVSFNELVRRNKARAKEKIEKYMQNNDNLAPRLPDISVDIFLKNTDTIINNLIKLRNKCLRISQPKKDSGCGVINSKGGFVLLIFDNDNRKSKLIYDSRTNDSLLTTDEFKNLLLRYQLTIST